MKKFASAMLGLSLLLGSSAITFGQDKMDTTSTSTKTKKAKKMKKSKTSTSTSTEDKKM